MRNRFKRVIREFFRLHYTDLPSHTDFVVGVKPAAAYEDTHSFRLQLREMLKRV